MEKCDGCSFIDSRADGEEQNGVHMRDKKLCKGVALILLSAMTACTGQLLWKLASSDNFILLTILGLILYGCGAILMIIALRYGELSILHPMMGAGYIVSLLLGSVVLKERITLVKILGVFVIIAGLVFCCASDERKGGE